MARDCDVLFVKKEKNEIHPHAREIIAENKDENISKFPKKISHNQLNHILM